MVTAGLLQQQYRSGGAGFHADAHDPHLAHLCPPLRGPAWPARGLAPTARRIGRPPTFHTLRRVELRRRKCLPLSGRVSRLLAPFRHGDVASRSPQDTAGVDVPTTPGDSVGGGGEQRTAPFAKACSPSVGLSPGSEGVCRYGDQLAESVLRRRCRITAERVPSTELAVIKVGSRSR